MRFIPSALQYIVHRFRPRLSYAIFIFAENVSDPFRERQYKSLRANPAVMSKGKEATAASPYPRAAAPGGDPKGVPPPPYYPPVRTS